jgi:hypothetical protein
VIGSDGTFVVEGVSEYSDEYHHVSILKLKEGHRRDELLRSAVRSSGLAFSLRVGPGTEAWTVRKQFIAIARRSARPASSRCFTDRAVESCSDPAQMRLRRSYRVQLEISSQQTKRLKQDWDNDGEDGFEFEVVDLPTPSKEPELETGEELQVLLELWPGKLRDEPYSSY